MVWGRDVRRCGHAPLAVRRGGCQDTYKENPTADVGLLAKRNKGAAVADRGEDMLCVGKGGPQSAFSTVAFGMNRGEVAASIMPAEDSVVSLYVVPMSVSAATAYLQHASKAG